MKKLLSIIVLSLLLSGSGYANEVRCALVVHVLENKYPCDTGPRLQELLDNPFFDYLPKPNNMTYDQYRSLIKSKIKKWNDGAEKRNKEYEAQRKKEVDLRCEILAGQANNTGSARKIYKKCMKAEGY